MNPQTGDLYLTERSKEAAEARGERIAELTAEQAEVLANMNRAERRAWAKKNLTREQRQASRGDADAG